MPTTGLQTKNIQRVPAESQSVLHQQQFLFVIVRVEESNGAIAVCLLLHQNFPQHELEA